MSNEVIHLKNILDYPYSNDILSLEAIFQAYDSGDDCKMFSIVENQECFNDEDFPLTLETLPAGVTLRRVAELQLYGSRETFFLRNKVSDLLTEPSKCIIIDCKVDSSNVVTYVCNL